MAWALPGTDHLVVPQNKLCLKGFLPYLKRYPICKTLYIFAVVWDIFFAQGATLRMWAGGEAVIPALSAPWSLARSASSDGSLGSMTMSPPACMSSQTTQSICIPIASASPTPSQHTHDVKKLRFHTSHVCQANRVAAVAVGAPYAKRLLKPRRKNSQPLLYTEYNALDQTT